MLLFCRERSLHRVAIKIIDKDLQDRVQIVSQARSCSKIIHAEKRDFLLGLALYYLYDVFISYFLGS